MKRYSHLCEAMSFALYHSRRTSVCKDSSRSDPAWSQLERREEVGLNRVFVFRLSELLALESTKLLDGMRSDSTTDCIYCISDLLHCANRSGIVVLMTPIHRSS